MGVDLAEVDCRREEEKLFGAKVHGKESLQLHIANSMRLTHGAEVLTEVQSKP